MVCGASEDSFLFATHSCLSLTLMRFDENGRKIHAPVAFRDQINLKQFLPEQCVKKDALYDYDLYGVIGETKFVYLLFSEIKNPKFTMAKAGWWK